MIFSAHYILLLALGFFWSETSLGFYIGNAVLPTPLQEEASVAQSHAASVRPREGVYVALQTTKSAATSTSTTTSAAKLTGKSASAATSTSKLRAVDHTTSVVMTKTYTTTQTATSTASRSSTSTATSAVETASHSTLDDGLHRRSSSTAMFTAGCFMAVFFSVVFIALIARLQRKRISPVLAAAKLRWKRVPWALKICLHWISETATSAMAGMKKSTKHSTRRITRLFDFDYRVKSLPPTPSTTSERRSLSSSAPFLPSPSLTPSLVPAPALAISPWPQPLEIRRQPSRQQYERRGQHLHRPVSQRREWRTIHPPFQQLPPFELPAVELPASPVPLQLLQTSGFGVAETASNQGDSYSPLDGPQIQQARLQWLHRMHNRVLVVHPPTLPQYHPYRMPSQRLAS